MLSRIAGFPTVALLWLLHFLPLPILAFIGRVLGMLFYCFGRQRRKIAAINLEWCFPELTEGQRVTLVRSHFQALGRSMLERSIFWWSSRKRLSRLIRVEGEEYIHALLDTGRPVILLAPHFVGLDAGGVAITMRFNIVSIYAEQASAIFDQLLFKGRSRFGDQLLLTRKDGIRASVKAMKSGRPFYYLPDISARRRDSVFVPFFGIPTATITATSRLAQAANAAVVPCVTRMRPGGQGYAVEIGAPWADYPTNNIEADTQRMNAWIESVIRTMPEQYLWVHRRFKLRPLETGEKRPY